MVEDIGKIESFSAVSGKKTPFSVTFQKLDAPAPTGISTQIEKQIFKPTAIIDSSPRSLVGLPRSVGGAGLTETQLQQGRGAGVQIQVETVQPLILQPSARQGLVQQVFLEPQLQTKLEPLFAKFDTTLRTDIRTKTLVDTRLDTRIDTRVDTRLDTRFLLDTRLDTRIDTKVKTKLRTETLTETLLEPLLDPIIPIVPGRKPRIPRDPFEFGFRPRVRFPGVPLLGGAGTRGRGKRRAKARTKVAPSFTAIVTGFEAPAFETTIAGIDIGILPGTVRGLETGFDIPKKKKKHKKKKKKK